MTSEEPGTWLLKDWSQLRTYIYCHILPVARLTAILFLIAQQSFAFLYNCSEKIITVLSIFERHKIDAADRYLSDRYSSRMSSPRFMYTMHHMVYCKHIGKHCSYHLSYPRDSPNDTSGDAPVALDSARNKLNSARTRAGGNIYRALIARRSYIRHHGRINGRIDGWTKGFLRQWVASIHVVRPDSWLPRSLHHRGTTTCSTNSRAASSSFLCVSYSLCLFLSLFSLFRFLSLSLFFFAWVLVD